MGNICRKPFQPLWSEEKAKTGLLELIHHDMIGPMLTQMIGGYRYIIIFTNDHSRWTNVDFMNGKCEAPAKFKKYMGTVGKQHPKSNVCRI
jgi:hypothetical protein